MPDPDSGGNGWWSDFLGGIAGGVYRYLFAGATALWFAQQWHIWSWKIIYDAIVCGVKQYYCWMVSRAVQLIAQPLFDPVLDKIPEQPPSGWAEVSFLYSAIDAWIPLTEFTGLWSAGMTFAGAMICYRALKKHLPWISG